MIERIQGSGNVKIHLLSSPEGGGAGAARAGAWLALPGQGADYPRVRGERVVWPLALWHFRRLVKISSDFDMFEVSLTIKGCVRLCVCKLVSHTYRVTIKEWNNVWLNGDLILSLGDFLSLLGAHQVWSIWWNMPLKVFGWFLTVNTVLKARDTDVKRHKSGCFFSFLEGLASLILFFSGIIW